MIEKNYRSWGGRSSHPLGLAYVAAYVRQATGVPITVIDGNCPLGQDGGCFVFPTVEQITNALVGHPFSLVGFSVVTMNYRPMLEIVRAVKTAHPERLIVLGGQHATLTWEDILTNVPEVDVIVLGEGESTFAELVDRVRQGAGWHEVAGIAFRRDGIVVRTPPRPLIEDLDTLPWPARDLLPPLSQYTHLQDPHAGEDQVVGTMVGSRGCPYYCSFCSIRAFYGSQPGSLWRTRSPANIVAEMHELVDKHGAEHISFWDDIFFSQAHRVENILREIIAHNLGVSFSLTARADLLVRNAHLLPLLRCAGCSVVEIGVESGSQAMLDRLNKKTTVEQNLRSIQLLRQHEIRVLVDFIMFDPDSTLFDLDANLRFYQEAGLWGYYPFRLFTRLRLQPGTPALREMQARGNTHGSIHDPPSYEFTHPEVARLYNYLLALRERLSGMGECLTRANALIMQLSGKGHLMNEMEQRISARCKLLSVRLKRMPYNMFRELLDLAQCSALTQKAFEQCAKQGEHEIARARAKLTQWEEQVYVPN